MDVYETKIKYYDIYKCDFIKESHTLVNLVYIDK
jgi:hypothetical protein